MEPSTIKINDTEKHLHEEPVKTPMIVETNKESSSTRASEDVRQKPLSKDVALSGLSQPVNHSTPAGKGVNLSKHLSLHLTPSPVMSEGHARKRTSRDLDPDDLPLIHLVAGQVSPTKNNQVGVEKGGHSTPATPSGTTPVTPEIPHSLLYLGKV